MEVKFKERWGQYGLIAEFVAELNMSPTFLQRIVYILQEVYGVPCGYHFSMIPHGPHSSLLADDLKFLLSSSTPMYRFKERGSSFLTKYRHEIDGAVKKFNNTNIKELDLLTTLIYVRKYNTTLTENELIALTKEIKPQFARDEIERTFRRFMSVVR